LLFQNYGTENDNLLSVEKAKSTCVFVVVILNAARVNQFYKVHVLKRESLNDTAPFTQLNAITGEETPTHNVIRIRKLDSHTEPY